MMMQSRRATSLPANGQTVIVDQPAVRAAVGLPVEKTTLIGRREEAERIRQLLMMTRLVTLTGIGGVGKTRLAIHVARSVAPALSDGVALVELAGVADPNLVALTIAQVLCVTNPAQDVLGSLTDYLRSRQMLLVLDNCEHLIDECAVLTSALISNCATLRVLVTSREPLRVFGEHVLEVPPLSVKPPGSTGDAPLAEALALFADRAAAAAPGFALTPENQDAVTTLCQRLDGLPLAIELAAGLMRALSPRELLSRLDHRYRLLNRGDRSAAPRHQSLWAALDWSYDLCSRSERVLWERLSVFAGPFLLDAAESICSDVSMPLENIAVGIAALVDKSIVIKQTCAGQPRYRMLESVREFGRQHLRDRDAEAAVVERYQAYYYALAKDFQARWFGPTQEELATRVRAEQANIRAVLDSLLDTAQKAQSALGMSSALFWYWLGCGQQREGRHWLDRSLSADTAPSSERAAALWANGYLAIAEGKTAVALEMLSVSVELSRQLGDDVNLAHATHFLGIAEHNRGDTEAGMALIQQGTAMEEAAGPSLLGLLALEQLGWAYCRRRDPERAQEVLEHGRLACIAKGERWLHSWILTFLALAHWMQQDKSTAAEYLREALIAKRRFQDALGIAVVVEMLAWMEPDPTRAACLMGAAERMWKPLGNYPGGFELPTWSEECAAEVRFKLGDDRFEAAIGEGRHMTVEQTISYALGEVANSASPSVDSAKDESTVLGLTRREAQVAQMLAEGLTNQQIARKLVVAPRTIDSHVEHIFKKLGVNSRMQVARMLTGSQR